jgi:AsmA protein
MRWIFRLLGVLVVLVALAIGALFLIPTNRIAEIAADRISAATGREVVIDGDIRPTIWPQLGVRAEDFVIGNPDWVREGPLLAAEALSVRVPWSAVFSGRVEVEEITLLSPEITLVRGPDGRASWQFETASGVGALDAENGPSAEDGGAVEFGLDRALVRDGRLVYLDLSTDQRIDVADLSADISLPRNGGATLDASAAVNGSEIGATGRVEDLAGFLEGGLHGAEVTLDWDGGEVRFAGTASLAPALDGTVQAEATDLAPLTAILGQPAPVLPEGLGRDRLAFDGQVTLASEGTAHLRNGVLRLDDNSLAMALDVSQGAARPLVRGTITSDAIRFAPGGGDNGGAADEASGAADGATVGWSQAPIDATALLAADVDLVLRVDQIDLGPVEVTGVDLRLTNSDGRAVAEIAGAGLYGGTLAGEFVARQNNGLSIRTDLFLVGVEMSPLFEALAGYDRLQGRGSASLEVLAVGNDMNSLMRSLDGQGDLAIGAGAIEGLDIAGMIRNFDDSYRGEGARTVFDSVTANFAIAGGVLQNDDLRLDAPWGGVTGAGRVDIGAQMLDYRLIPGVMRDADGVAGLEVPILITGPWANPSIRPDLQYLAEQELAAQAEALEAEAERVAAEQADRVEAEARDRINEALNLDLQEGDTAEDARDAVIEEVGNQLLNLLGGN